MEFTENEIEWMAKVFAFLFVLGGPIAMVLLLLWFVLTGS